MPAQTSPYDVWIIETNSVYRGVPFTVVADWAQEGRLLESDKVRQAGSADWRTLAEVPAFAVYLPRVEPHESRDQAEALEPVELGFEWKRPAADDDEDVDMIPLIDVSLVLLIFFMMTATVTSAASLIKTPMAGYGSQLTDNPQMVWIGLEQGADGRTLYSLGRGTQPAPEEDRLLNRQALFSRLEEVVRAGGGPAEVMIKADEGMPEGVIKDLRFGLDRLRSLGLVRAVRDEVREGENR
jgi:biopolymer transport protein ExbD